MLTLHCFGSLAVRKGRGAALTFPTRRSRALLAFLAVESGWHSRQELSALFWPNRDGEAARRSLRQELSTLRSVIGATHIEADADRARVVDVHISEGGGVFLAGFPPITEPFDEWVRERRAKLRDGAAASLEREIDTAEREGRIGDAIAAARRLLEIEPTREATHRTVMACLALDGKHAAAMQQYRSCVTALRRELQIAPSRETTALYESIRATRQSARRRILVVDDNAVTRVQLDALLTEARFDVALADHGANALIDLGGDGVDLVVTDIDMPMLDGLQLLEVVRARTGQAPVLVITALQGRDVERQARRLGAAGFLRKPIDGRALLLAVRKALHGAAVKKPSKAATR
jgi:DNA-binding SARP family transcriptional activator